MVERKIRLNIEDINDNPVSSSLTHRYSQSVSAAALEIVSALQGLNAEKAKTILTVALKRISDFAYVNIENVIEGDDAE